VGKYKQASDNDIHTIDPMTQNIKFACCDCGSVHFFTFEPREDGLLDVNIAADERATSQLRRYGKIHLLENSVKNWKMIRRDKNGTK